MCICWGVYVSPQGWFRAYTLTHQGFGSDSLAALRSALLDYPFSLFWYQEVDGDDVGVYTVNVFNYDGDEWNHREIARNWMLA